MKEYQLEIENCGDEMYRFLSKGHHDPDEFMKAIRTEGYNYSLLPPSHLWFRTVPDATGEFACRYHETKPGSRGAFPVTYTHECSLDDAYKGCLTPPLAGKGE